MKPRKIDRVPSRADFPALGSFIWFDNGVVSLTPLPVAEELAARLEEISLRGPMHVSFPEEEYPRRRESHRRIAAFLGAESTDIALVRGVSEAFETVLLGIDWRAGDGLIISGDEEAALLLPSLHLRDSVGVTVTMLPVEAAADELAQRLDSAITPRTRLVALSHVGTNFGYRLPVRELAAVARRHDVTTFVDVAHSAGLFPMRVDDLGCDFVGALSYKWMYGPYAAGLLWARPEAVGRIRLRFAGNRSEVHLDEQSLAYELRPTTDRFEFGPWTWPVIHGWATAVDYVDRLTTARVWDRTVELATRLKTGLSEIDGVSVLTPLEPARSAALVTFALEGIDCRMASRSLRERYNIRIKFVPKGTDMLRASIAFFTTEQDVDRLLEAVEEIVSGRSADSVRLA